MEIRGRSPTRGSNYGLACMQCVKAKCRCVPRPSGGSCERCLRLRKDCQPSDSARKRNALKEKESDARIAHLEGKIDTLLSVMQTAASSSSSSIDLHRLLNGETMSLPMTGSSGTSTANSTSTNLNASQGPTPPTESFPTAPPSSNPSPPALSDITAFEAEASFNFFRSRMLPCFPFISLAPNVTVWQIRQNRPFLFQAIITVTTLSTQTKFARVEELKRLIFTSALLDVQSSFDLLVGILTYVAWSTDAFLGRADLLSRLMMLAISLVYDLRLFKPPPPDVQMIVTLTQGFSEDSRLANEETLQSFMDQQRAVLACFVLSSNISSHFGRIDALRWTPQMEEALRMIEKNKPYPTDERFVFEVRLHLLMQRAAHIREQQETDRARTTATTTTAAPVPAFLYLKALRGQLQEYRDALSPELQQQDILTAYTQYVELYIDQAGRLIGSGASLLSVSGPGIESAFVPGYERIGSLWRSVESVKAWLDAFYKLPVAQCLGLPFHFWSQLIRCTTILKYLTTLDDPAWDCQAVRQKVDIIEVLEWMSNKLNLISEEAGLQSSDDLFKLLSKLLNGSREWVETKFKAVNQTPVNEVLPDIHTTSFEADMPDLDYIPWLQSMDLDNDKWFEEVLGWSPCAF